jgi:peptidyl-prolyl cis-trans isomerase D
LPGLADAVFAMEVGDVSGAIETDLGIFVVRLTGSQEAGTRPVEDVRDALIAQLQRRNATEALFDFSAEIDQALIASQSLEEIAETYNLSLVAIAGLAEDASVPTGSAVPNNIDLKLVADEVFYLEQGEVSPLLESGGSSYVAIRVDGITPESTEPMETVREQLVDMWLALEQRRIAAEAAQIIDEAITAGDDWPTAITKAGLDASRIEIQTVTGLTRRDEQADLPPSMRRAAFELKEQGNADRLRIADAWNILRLDGLGNAEVDDRMGEQIKTSLNDSIAFDLLSQYQRILDERYPASINYNIINSFHNPAGTQGNGGF